MSTLINIGATVYSTVLSGDGEAPAIPDGVIIDPDTSYYLVDPDDGTTYIIEA